MLIFHSQNEDRRKSARQNRDRGARNGHFGLNRAPAKSQLPMLIAEGKQRREEKKKSEGAQMMYFARVALAEEPRRRFWRARK